MSSAILIASIIGIVAAFFLVARLTYIVATRIIDAVQCRRLIRLGKTIEWSSMKAKACSGLGTVILNNSNTPGCIWYVERHLKDNNHDAFDAMREDAVMTISPFPIFLHKSLIYRSLLGANIVETRGVIRSHPMQRG